MDTLRELLFAHEMKYPGMQPQDYIKLLFQREMGVEHAVKDAGIFYQRLREELANPEVAAQGTQQPEALGNGLCRVYLGQTMGATPKTLAVLCLLAARQRKGSKKELKKQLEELVVWADGAAACPGMGQEVAEYIAEGCPAVGHSGRYKALYSPHYRLMDTAAALYMPLFAKIDRALAQKAHILVGVDGMSGAGKSELGKLLAQVYGCGVVHADDFFLQPWQRSEERLATAGGNIDYERLAPVAAKAADDRAFAYQAYDCQTQKMGVWREVPKSPITLLEGVYALHPAVKAACDVRVFLGVDADVQADRVLRRSGPGLAARFEKEWIPMENRYFGEFDIREGCDIVVDTTEL